jgi:hypothetical protein
MKNKTWPVFVGLICWILALILWVVLIRVCAHGPQL